MTGDSKAHILTLVDAPFTLNSLSEFDWQLGSIAPWYCKGALNSANTGCSETSGLFMDLGSSYFHNWNGLLNTYSQAWLYDRYHLRNVRMNNVFAYEYQVLDPALVFAQVPHDVVPFYHWVNAPVESKIGGKMNPWTTLYALQRQPNEDVTIVKIDIDTMHLENELVRQIIEGPPSGIDELFYEHHVNLAPLHGNWQSVNFTINLYDSFKMFQNLRRLGIRSHSWP